jgi:L-amino acid N-acyltransferase YncA
MTWLMDGQQHHHAGLPTDYGLLSQTTVIMQLGLWLDTSKVMATQEHGKSIEAAGNTGLRQAGTLEEVGAKHGQRCVVWQGAAYA